LDSITHHHDTWYKITYVRNSVFENQQDRLAIDEESDVGTPYTHCDDKDDPVSVPDSNPGSTHERLTSKRRSRRMEDVRANHNQQHSAGKSTISKEQNKLTVTSMLSTEYMEGLTASEVIQALGL